MYKKCRVLLLLLLPFALHAQHNVKFVQANFKNNPNGLQTAIDNIKQGDYNIQIQEYSLALPYYLIADSINPNNADLNMKIGVCYLNSNDYKARCLRYFLRAYGLDKNVSKRMPYFLGCGYHLNYRWDSAINEFKSFMGVAGPKDKKAMNKQIEECNNGKDLMQHPVPAALVNLGPNINSPYRDYAPFLNADESEMVFTSKRSNTTGGQIDPSTGEYFEDIYTSRYKDGAWLPAENIGLPINTTDNDATAYLTPDGQKLFIYRDINGGDIYVSSYSPQGWSIPKPLDKNINSAYHESSVCLSPDRQTLYFVSDRPGGKGGRDIYKSYIQPDSSWGPAINLGDTINTEYDEEGVFIHPDGTTMYFSSKGHNTMGGYDIFRSIKENGVWGIPQNLGYPINSPDDDVFFMVSASGAHGYYASAKDTGGYGSLDIYQVSMEALKALKPKLIVMKGSVLDSVTQLPLSAAIKLVNKTAKTTTPSNSNMTSGAYVLTMPSGNEYEIDVHVDGYPDYTTTMKVADTETYKEVKKNICLLKPGTAVHIKIDSNAKIGKPDTCAITQAMVMTRFEGFTKDTMALMNMVSHMGDNGVCLKDMEFTVQIGAYHFPRNFKYKKVEIKPVAINDSPDGITRFTMGNFITYKEAVEFKEVVIKKGIKDAFICGIYAGKRVLLNKLLHPDSK
jgi:hypothetical protein